MKGVDKLILEKIKRSKRGIVFFPEDFSEYGSTGAIRIALHRLVVKNEIKRVAQGIYNRPKLSQLVGEVMPTAEEIAKVIPKSIIVKGFNTVFSSILKSSPQFGNQRANLFICGNENDSKRILMEIGRVLGYEPIDIGPLKASRYLEALTLFQIYLGDVLNNWEFTFKLLIRDS